MTDTDTSTEKTYLTITLTDAAPVRVAKADWPVVASARDWDGEFEFQANRKWRITVRQHADGRALVYGAYESQWANEDGRRAGLIVEADELVRAIRAVGEGIGASAATVQSCIAHLPARELV